VYEHWASASDTSAAQISTASPQHRAMFMAAFLECPGKRTGPGRRRACTGRAADPRW
jgi:hypothetical protein